MAAFSPRHNLVTADDLPTILLRRETSSHTLSQHRKGLLWSSPSEPGEKGTHFDFELSDWPRWTSTAACSCECTNICRAAAHPSPIARPFHCLWSPGNTYLQSLVDGLSRRLSDFSPALLQASSTMPLRQFTTGRREPPQVS
jgi:hypothetical protein